MLPLLLIAPTTAVQSNIQANCTEADKAIFATCGGALAAAEVVNFSVPTSQGGKTPVYNAAGTQVQLTATVQSVMLEGGIEYILDKAASVASVGVDVSYKPRIGAQ